MNLKPIFVLIIIVSLILQLRNCEYGAEHQVKFGDFDPKYKNAHLTAVSAQKMLGDKEYAEALRYYEMARDEMEHPNVRADKGEDIYINYGFVMNDIGVIHLSWALYGKEMNTDVSHIDLNEINEEELLKAKEALNEAIDFYKRWYEHNQDDYERFAKAIAESYANLGTALKYSGEQEKALEAFRKSLLRNPDKSKLSKRKNPTSINFYERMGFLPEAVTNYLGRMGWSMPDEREKFTLEEMIEQFDIQRVSLGGPVFDVEKLRWLNGQWIRDELSEDQFIERMRHWWFNEQALRDLVPHIKARADVFSDVAPMASFMFSGMLDLKPEDFSHNKLDEAQLKRVLQFTLWKLEAQRHWSKDNIFADIKTLAKAMGLKMGDFMFAIFVAIAGTPNSWSVMDSMAILGPDMTRSRLRHALEVTGGFSKKETKRVEKEYASLLAE